jgi:glycosyltransferase involved in cell wall biosynthesis
MHIAWVHDAALLRGGAERYMHDTAPLLRERGVRSTLLYDVGLPSSTAMLGAFDGAFPALDLLRQLNELQPDVVYAHQISRPAVLETLARSPAPVFRFLHDHRLFCLREHKYTTIGHRTCERTVGLGCYPCLGFVSRGAGALGIRLVSVGMLRREQRRHDAFHGFVVASSYMADHVAAHGFDRARIHVVPLYAEVPDEESPPTRERDLLLFVGGLVRGKGLDVLLDALPLSRQAPRLTVVGDGRQAESLRRQAAALVPPSRVTFLGRQPPGVLAEWFRRAACVVVPSRSPETFGLAGLEAMSHGTPVIATDVGGIREWLVPGETGLAVPPNDPRRLAAAIDQLLADPYLGDLMGRRGRTRHRATFLPEHHVDRLLELFRAARPPCAHEHARAVRRLDAR